MRLSEITLRTLFIYITLLVCCFSWTCKKRLEGAAGLPPITNNGSNTFGCLVDGKLFIPRTRASVSEGVCSYQRIYNTDPGRIFTITANYQDFSNSCLVQGIAIHVDSVDLQQGETYQIRANKRGAAFGGYLRSSACSVIDQYNTDTTTVGQITINFLDTVYQIVSGTFYYDAVSETGDTVHITEGRFDRHYIQ